MEEIYLGEPLPVFDRETVAAVLSITLDSGDGYVNFTANPNDGSVTMCAQMSEEDDLAFDVEDFALVTTLLVRQAQRAI